MFGALADMVRQVDIPLERDALRELFAVRDLLTSRLDAAVGAYEAAGRHDADGAVTLRSWLVHQTAMDPVSASRTASRARLLHAAPAVAEAALDGRLSGGQVEVIAANVPARHRALFAEHAPALVDVLTELDVDGTVHAMAEWRRLADDVDPRSGPRERDDELYLVRTLHDRGDLRGSFGPDLTAVVETALRVAVERDDDRTLAARRADALGAVCRHFLDHQQTRPARRHRPHLTVVLDADAATYVGGAADGMAVSAAELAVLLCDSVLHRLLVAGSGILDHGRGTRTIPTELFNTLVLRDRGCRFPGCDRPASWCDAHHVEHWEDGGHTRLDNLALLCRRHHRKLHAGWTATLHPDGSLDVTHPDGRTETSHARGPTTRRRRPPVAA